MVLLLLLVTGWVLIQLPPVQTWLVSNITSSLSSSLHTKVRIRHVDFSLFDKMILQGTLVEDHQRDTLLYAEQLKVNITDWWFFRDTVVLKYIGLEGATIKLQRTDSVWNYQFLIDYFSGPPSKDKGKAVQLNLKTLAFDHIHFLKKDAWRGEDMDCRLIGLDLDADYIDLSNKKAKINSLLFSQPDFTLTNYDGRRPPLVDTVEEVYVNDPFHLRLNPDNWAVSAGKVTIRNGSFTHEVPADTHPNKHFDGNHIYFYNVNTSFDGLRLNKDTLTAQMQLSTRERSGLEVKHLRSKIKWFPEAMEFGHLDLLTGRSHLKNFFSMRFKSLDDMSDFITKVHMEADFEDAEVDTDDIAWFAPDAREWKKHIRITGHLHGPVADLNGRNVFVKAGDNTYLKGDIHLKGLPHIATTYIEFLSHDLRTTYGDMITLFPGLKTITQPRLDRIQNLHFTGSFTGYIRDFVTNGTIETNLGTLVTDVNMQIPEGIPSIYHGTVSTENFNIGAFLDNDDIGNIAFSGKVDGKGLKINTVNATLNGAIRHLTFHGYDYQDIRVNGNVAKKLFNGELTILDSNLNMHLNGLINFSQATPKFDFDAQVARADLSKLHFLNRQVEFNGKFKCNFTGDNVDNFLGTASIYDASVFKDGQRVSFDSLSLESTIIDNNKTITVVSNEFDGAIVGEFSIHNLPASFQTFLNKYYPSYIKAARVVPANQNFSFVITTKKVDEYIDLFEKNLKGFNNTGISGRINTRDNLLDLNADVPSFGYKNIAFNNLTLKGRGNLDTLSLETNIGDVNVNDSLHFPGTHIQLRSSNDLSSIQVTTSANQTLNSANISAQVQTMSTGVKIVFAPSTFEINSKPWMIDKDGELAFDRNVLSAYGLRIHSGDQQVLISTHPSGEGNWNDVHVDLKSINIGDFTPYFVKSERIEGLLTGAADLTDPFGKPEAVFNGQADQFRFANDSIGHLDLGATYAKSTGVVNATAHSDNKNYHFDLKGAIQTADSSQAPPIDIHADIADTRIDLIEHYLTDIFSNLSGNATGTLQVVGPANRLQYLGNIKLRDGSMKVNYTQCTYKIPSATIAFKTDTIDFGTLRIVDKYGHTADLTRGRLMHHSFDDLAFDFAMNTNRLLLLDTKATDNNQFYGTVIGKANMTVTGPETNMQINIKGEPVDSSNIYLPPSISRESGDADNIVWKVYGKEMKAQVPDHISSSYLVNLDMYANNFANVYVILDPLTGDIIKTNGHGSLNMKVGSTQPLTLTGRYEIDRGNYKFNLQSVVHKPFILSEGVGNYIQWNGDPYDATIGIEAIYRAEGVRFSDLGLNSSAGIAIQNDNVRRYRGDILVITDLTGNLMHPNIEFQIEMPPNSPLKNDQEALAIMQKIQGDKNELNKQVSTLLVFNSFAPLTNSTNSFDATSAFSSAVVNSISGIITNALSKQFYHILEKIFNDKNIRFNMSTTLYNGSNLVDNLDQSRLSLDRTNLNFSIEKSYLNEKLTFIFGSAFDFGMTSQQVAASSFQFLPDISAEYKIRADGRIVLTFFYRDSYNYLSVGSHTQNSSGASISYRRDFDRIDELFKKKKKKDRNSPPGKKQKKVQAPALPGIKPVQDTTSSKKP